MQGNLVERDGDPNIPTHTLTHTSLHLSPPAIQTHSHAFTHLLCPPHEELKIDDSTTKGVGRKREIGEKDEEGSQSSSKMREERDGEEK